MVRISKKMTKVSRLAAKATPKVAERHRAKLAK